MSLLYSSTFETKTMSIKAQPEVKKDYEDEMKRNMSELSPVL